MNTTKLMLMSKVTVLQFVPKDSGNLARSIRVYKTPRGFRIVSLGNQAPYNAIVNRGRKDRPLSVKEQRNVGYWKKARDAVARLIYSNQNTSINSDTYKTAVRKTQLTSKTQAVFNRSIPKVGG